MRFDVRTLSMAKDAEFPEQTQDAFALDAQRGVAAVADGAAQGLFSGLWARILAQAVVEQPPQLDVPGEFSTWLTRQRALWSGQIDVATLPWFQKSRLIHGGASTLLWIELCPVASGDGEPETCQLRSVAIGDSCLFHVREGQLLRAFPIEDESGFGIDPQLVGSVDLKRDHMMEFKLLEDECRPGDLLVLCTDAIAQWATRRRVAGEVVDWERFWDMPLEAWMEEVAVLRRQSLMRYDDNTLVLLRVQGTPAVVPACAEDASPPADVPAGASPDTWTEGTAELVEAVEVLEVVEETLADVAAVSAEACTAEPVESAPPPSAKQPQTETPDGVEPNQP